MQEDSKLDSTMMGANIQNSLQQSFVSRQASEGGSLQQSTDYKQQSTDYKQTANRN